MLSEREFLRKVLSCDVSEGLSTHTPPYKKMPTRTYTYHLECGHTMIRHGEASGERKAIYRKFVICDWCMYGEERSNE